VGTDGEQGQKLETEVSSLGTGTGRGACEMLRVCEWCPSLAFLHEMLRLA
jgi:hypothetical protein